MYFPYRKAVEAVNGLIDSTAYFQIGKYSDLLSTRNHLEPHKAYGKREEKLIRIIKN